MTTIFPLSSWLWCGAFSGLDSCGVCHLQMAILKKRRLNWSFRYVRTTLLRIAQHRSVVICHHKNAAIEIASFHLFTSEVQYNYETNPMVKVSWILSWSIIISIRITFMNFHWWVFMHDGINQIDKWHWSKGENFQDGRHLKPCGCEHLSST